MTLQNTIQRLESLTEEQIIIIQEALDYYATEQKDLIENYYNPQLEEDEIKIALEKIEIIKELEAII